MNSLRRSIGFIAALVTHHFLYNLNGKQLWAE
jgi:hypothetical protein